MRLCDMLRFAGNRRACPVVAIGHVAPNPAVPGGFVRLRISLMMEPKSGPRFPMSVK